MKAGQALSLIPYARFVFLLSRATRNTGRVMGGGRIERPTLGL